MSGPFSITDEESTPTGAGGGTHSGGGERAESGDPTTTPHKGGRRTVGFVVTASRDDGDHGGDEGGESLKVMRERLRAPIVPHRGTRVEERRVTWRVIVHVAQLAAVAQRAMIFGGGRRFYKFGDLRNDGWRTLMVSWRVSYSVMRSIQRRRRAAAVVIRALPLMARFRMLTEQRQLRGLDTGPAAHEEIRRSLGGSTIGDRLSTRLKTYERRWSAAQRLVRAALASRRFRLVCILSRMNAVESTLVGDQSGTHAANDAPLQFPFATSGNQHYLLDPDTRQVRRTIPFRARPSTAGSSVLTFREPIAVSDVTSIVFAEGDSVDAAMARLSSLPLLMRFKRAVAVKWAEQQAGQRHASYLRRRAAINECATLRHHRAVAAAVQVARNAVPDLPARFRKRAGLLAVPSSGSRNDPADPDPPTSAVDPDDEFDIPLISHARLFPTSEEATAFVEEARALQLETLRDELFCLPRAYAKVAAPPPPERQRCQLAAAALRQQQKDSHSAEAEMLTLSRVPFRVWSDDRLLLRQPNLDEKVLQRSTLPRSSSLARRLAGHIDDAIAAGAARASRHLWLTTLRYRLRRHLRPDMDPARRTAPFSKTAAKSSVAAAAGTTVEAATQQAPTTWVDGKPYCLNRRVRGRTPPDRKRALYAGDQYARAADKYFVPGVDDAPASASEEAATPSAKPHRKVRKKKTKAKSQTPGPDDGD